jgi:hypothetical protein
MKTPYAFASRRNWFVHFDPMNTGYADTLQSIVLIGQYDLWVKRGVVSVMGAKLHPSPRVYRVYAPSTHSLPVIKCVTGVNGAAEVEFKSCHSGITRLRDLSPLYQRLWNSGNTPADKLSLKAVGQDARRTFSVVSIFLASIRHRESNIHSSIHPQTIPLNAICALYTSKSNGAPP